MIAGNKNVELGYNRLTHGQIIGAVLFSAYGFGLCMYLWWGFGFVESDDRVTRIVFYQSLTRTIYAPIFAFGPSAFIGGILLIVKGMVTGKIFKEKRG